MMPGGCQLLQCFFNLVCYALTTDLDAIVGEVAGVPLRRKNMETVFAVSFPQR